MLGKFFDSEFAGSSWSKDCERKRLLFVKDRRRIFHPRETNTRKKKIRAKIGMFFQSDSIQKAFSELHGEKF